MKSRVRILSLAPMFLLSACTGMYLGVNGDEGREDSSSSSDEVSGRADIFNINTETMYRVVAERRAADELRQARREAAAKEVAPRYQYLIAPQDVLNITIWNHPELNNPAGQLTTDLAGRVVNDQGSFFYPYIGKVEAAGRSTADIRNELARRLSQYLTEPQVDVSVLQYRGRKAFAAGELKTPGPMPITDVPMRVTDLIALAGGLTEKADVRNVVLTRGGVARQLNLYALYYEGDLTQDVLLQEGDIINVPEQRFNKVFVLGEVASPASRLMPRGRYTLSEAISDAGGLNPITSNGSQVYVLRASEAGRPQIWHLDAKSPEALVLADNFDLQPRDVVFVDAAGVTRWSRVLNQILPTSTFLVTGAKNVNDISGN